MYAKRTVFDLVLPRIMAGERLSREDLVRYGEGGLCLNCLGVPSQLWIWKVRIEWEPIS